MNEAPGMPSRTADTMSDAIALSSPSGRMSNRARKAAHERLRLALFGPDGLQSPTVVQPDERTVLLRQAAELRGERQKRITVIFGMSQAR